MKPHYVVTRIDRHYSEQADVQVLGTVYSSLAVAKARVEYERVIEFYDCDTKFTDTEWFKTHDSAPHPHPHYHCYLWNHSDVEDVEWSLTPVLLSDV